MPTATVDLLDIDPFDLVADEVPWVAVTAHLKGLHDQKDHGRKGKKLTPAVEAPAAPKAKPAPSVRRRAPARNTAPKKADPTPATPVRRGGKSQADSGYEAPKPASWTSDVSSAKDMFAKSYGADPTPEQLATMNKVFGGTHAGLKIKDVHMRFRGDSVVEFDGGIYDQSGSRVGFFSRELTRESDGTISATHDKLQLDTSVRGQGFAQSFNGRLIEWYKASGVSQIQLTANIDVGGYAWARAGYDWIDDDAPSEPLQRLQKLAKTGTQRIPPDRAAEQQALAATMLRRFEETEFGSADYPTPFEVSQLGRWPGAGKDDWWIGKAAMMGSSWDGVKLLGRSETAVTAAMSPHRRQKLVALGELHNQWVTANLESAAKDFDPSGRKDGSDYNLHHVDLDADSEAQDRFFEEAMRIVNGEGG
jgi:hypothetical protein